MFVFFAQYSMNNQCSALLTQLKDQIRVISLERKIKVYVVYLSIQTEDSNQILKILVFIIFIPSLYHARDGCTMLVMIVLYWEGLAEYGAILPLGAIVVFYEVSLFFLCLTLSLSRDTFHFF